MPPKIETRDSEILITFIVEHQGGDTSCPSNDVVPYVVDLGQPLGNRALVDAVLDWHGGVLNALLRFRRDPMDS